MDNRYWEHGCPPLMSDGRWMRSFTDMDLTNQYIRKVNGLKNGDDFRYFLQKNAKKIHANEQKYLDDHYLCKGINKDTPVSNSIPNDCHRYYGAPCRCNKK